MRWCPFALCAALLGWLPAQHAELRAALPATELHWGEAFELQVVVRWPVATELAPIDARQFAPLQVELLSAPVVGTASEAVFRYRARALAVGDLVVGPVVVRSAAGAGTASCAPLPLRVRSALPEPAGALEWPGDVREPAMAGRSLLFAGIALLVGLAGVWWWRRPAAAQPGAVVVADDFGAALAALSLPADAAATAAFYRDVKALLRAHASRRHGLRADFATSEELLRALPERELLARCLLACDGVLFAAMQPAAAAHAAARQAAIDWVRTASAVAP